MSANAYDECSREPIHLLGAIQPCGILIICRIGSWVVAHASENVDTLFGKSAEEVIGSGLRTLFSSHGFHSIANLASALGRDRECQRALGLSLFDSEDSYDVSVHRIGGNLYVEIETRNSRFVPQENLSFVQSFLSALVATSTDDDYFASIAKQIRLLTGFDRVMMYRFDDDGSGEVIAESMRATLPSYLGLRYPATDIPQQARILFVENRVRTIGDVDAVIVPVLPRQERQEANPDLGMTSLRSVSEVHLRYLRNMGVSASLSLSIVIEGKLWGLIACHHRSPKWVGMERRSTLDMIGLLVSLQIDARMRASVAAGYERKHNLLQSTISSIDPDASLAEELRKRIPALLDLIPCDGIGLWIESSWHSHDVQLTSLQLSQLIAQLDRTDFSDIFVTHSIARLCPSFAIGDRAPAGMLVLPISRAPQDYILFFRKESASHVRWAGNPDTPKDRDETSGKLNPRASFEEWRAIQRHHSKPWSGVDIGIARQFRTSILEFVLRYSALTQKHRDAAIERQRLLVAELNHRVKNMLALFQSLVGHERDLQGTTIQRYVSNLRGRILALAAAHDNIVDARTERRSLRNLLQSELRPYLSGHRRCDITDIDVALSKEAFSVLALVIHEMTTNAVKYGALSADEGRIEIHLSQDAAGRFEIEWVEQGGPVLSPTTEEGLGTTIIKRLIPHELRGEAEVKLEVGGLRARFVLPAACVTAIAPISAGDPPLADSLPADAPSDFGVIELALVLDDNMLIALDTESMLLDLGVRNIEIASNLADARWLIDQRKIDLAVLDINLGSETSLSFADTLKELGIPIVFLSGYGQVSSLAERHARIPSVEKPAHREALKHAIRAAIQTQTGTD